MILAMLLMAAPTTAVPPDAAWNCANPQVQQEMNWCAAQEYKRSDEALNAQWSRTAAALKQRDAEGAGTSGVGAAHFATLLKAQRAWLAYRDAHCSSEGLQFHGGSMEPLVVGSCKTKLTQMRTQQLKALIEGGG